MKKNLNKKRLIIILMIVMVVIFAVWRLLGTKKETIQYQTAAVERGTIISAVTASGQVLTSNVVNVTTQATGMVKQIYVTDGEVVVAGQKIMEIELDQSGQQKNASAWSSYLSAKNSLDAAKITAITLQSDMFTKWKAYMDAATSTSYDSSGERDLPDFWVLKDNWLASEAKYKSQDAVIIQSQTAVDNAWKTYELTSPTVTSPISGTITSFTVVEGVPVGDSTSTSTTTISSQKLAVIQNEQAPLASFNVSEIDVPKIKIGQKATIILDSIPDKTFTGIVASLDRTGAVSSNVTNYPAIIKFDTKVPDILSNMAATANIIVATKNNVLIVSSAAVKTSNGQATVGVLINGETQSVNVETGISSDTQTEIVSGLKTGDIVITGSAQTSITKTQTGTSVFGGFGGRGGFGR